MKLQPLRIPIQFVDSGEPGGARVAGLRREQRPMRGSLAHGEVPESVEASIATILTTPKGALSAAPAYGCELAGFRHRPMRKEDLDLVPKWVEAALLTSDPRIAKVRVIKHELVSQRHGGTAVALVRIHVRAELASTIAGAAAPGVIDHVFECQVCG